MNWVAAGFLCCAVAVVAGAFGAHGLERHLEPASLALWETAARYLMYGGLGLAVAGLASHALNRPIALAGWSLLIGSAIFSGTVFALALGAPRWLGAVTPVGGTLMILGLLVLAWTSWRG